MAHGPRPAGWKGGKEDFEFILNGSGGRCGVNVNSDGSEAADGDYRRNAYTQDDFEEHFGCR